MKKVLLLIVGLVFAFQLSAVAAEKYKAPKVPNGGNIYQRIDKEEKDCDDISPTKHKKDKKDNRGHHYGHEKGKGNQ